ncbi:TRAP-type C4-dicarboxylate transport system, small permease component [Jannaschia faecimaris]|uniref:TRAP transporter small permease protein n=1 Tax=Jannaschia faecimaris TaxID=1244108 RepID=A0A1H3TJP9_9RHOB|nr:TRAP transporter small permease subunit [Jannaschia faecimaris]SDZ50098.1 TRAP-type C4-dicarboxylate transport system, small permease component [Jannaschia faecimaris]
MTDWAPVLGLPLWVWLFILPSLIATACYVAGPRLEPRLRPIWRALDVLYLASGCLSAVFMVMILLLIVAQMIARWTGVTLPGTTEFAGYAMAGTSFFALCHALTRGAHIRVSIILNANAFLKRWLDLFAVFGAAVIATYFARYAIKANGFSALLNDRTQGQDQIPEWIVTLLSLPSRAPGEWGSAMAGAGDGLVYTPLWIPQLAMSAGTVLLAIALWDTLCRMAVTGTNPIVSEAVE